jgi:hypothetical protein
MNHPRGAVVGPGLEVPGAAYRWGQLLMGLVCMAMVANLQYGWTLFVDPFGSFRLSQAAVQVAFSVRRRADLLAPFAGSGSTTSARARSCSAAGCCVPPRGC